MAARELFRESGSGLLHAAEVGADGARRGVRPYVLDDERRWLEQGDAVPRMQSFDPPYQFRACGSTDTAAERRLVVSLDGVVQAPQESTAVGSNSSDELEMSSHLLELEKRGAAAVDDARAHVDDALPTFLRDRSGLGDRVQFNAEDL